MLLLLKADSDKNGSIDYTEFSGLWSSLKGEEEVGWGPGNLQYYSTIQEKIRDEFFKYDTDKNGVITRGKKI